MMSNVLQRPPASQTARPQRPTRQRRGPGIPPIRGLLPIFIGLAAWQLLGTSEPFSFPQPSEWLGALGEMIEDGSLQEAFGRTLLTFLLAMALSTAAGVSLGILLGASRRLDRGTGPVLDFFRALPPPALISVIVLAFGSTYSSGLLMVVLGAVWPILLNTVGGMRSIPALRRETSLTLGLTRWDHLIKVLLPSLLPSAFLGIKVATSIAFVVTLFVEILGIIDGLGHLMVERKASFDSASVWALLLLIGICGYLINVGVALLERVLLKGQQA